MMSQIDFSSEVDEPTPGGAAASPGRPAPPILTQEQIRRRRRRTFLIRVVTSVLSVSLVVFAAALIAGSLSFMPPEYLVNRYVPGGDSHITIKTAGDHVLLRTGSDVAPDCAVATDAGVPVAPYADVIKGQAVRVFTADEGGYSVSCAGGNSDVIVFPIEQMDMIAYGNWTMVLVGLPFGLLGVAIGVSGRLWARKSRVPTEQLPWLDS